MIDNLGCYTKALKYDAVPTLFLPHPVIIKVDFEENMQLHTEETEMKDLIVYNVTSDNITFQTESLNGNAVEDMNVPSEHLTSENALKGNPDALENNSEDAIIRTKLVEELALNPAVEERLDKIITQRDHLDLLVENELFRKETVQLESRIKCLQNSLKRKSELFNTCNTEYRKTCTKYHSVKNQSKSFDDQLKILAKVFSESQIKILTGKKKIYWSNDDMAMGYTIRHMSNKRCYIYLSKTLNIPLPALSSIKRWVTLKKSEFDKIQNKVEVCKEEEEDSN